MFDYFLYIEIFFPDLKKIFLYIEMSSYFLYMKNNFSQCVVTEMSHLFNFVITILGLDYVSCPKIGQPTLSSEF